MSDRDKRVRDEAYRIWDEKGRPEGPGDDHWYEAERRIAQGEQEPAAPAEKPRKGKTVKVVAKSAGNSGVAVPVAAPKKGDAVEVAPAKPKKPKADKAEAAPKAKPAKSGAKSKGK